MNKFFNYYRGKAVNKQVSSVAVAIRCLVKGFLAKENNNEVAELSLKAAFTPIRRQTKLTNGSTAYQALDHALRYAKFYLNREGSELYAGNFFEEDELEAFLDFIKTVKGA